jgi:multicomponent Na+:H+ antiporter subunit F
MTDFLLWMAGLVLAMVALGLVPILHGPNPADRMMAAQLSGTGGVAVLLLLAVATSTPPIVDVALMLALLAALVSVGFVSWGNCCRRSGSCLASICSGRAPTIRVGRFRAAPSWLPCGCS